jgi:hypothetical protein
MSTTLYWVISLSGTKEGPWIDVVYDVVRVVGQRGDACLFAYRSDAHKNARWCRSNGCPNAKVFRVVKAKRRPCLVARAVKLGVELKVTKDTFDGAWVVEVKDEVGTTICEENNVHAEDVPAVLSRMLDEVEALAEHGEVE